MTITIFEQKWKAEEYHNNSSAQNKAATKILQHINFEGNEHVLDVGCGDGKITAKLANCLINGFVHGVDASPEMIEYAKKSYQSSSNPNLQFSIQNASQLNYSKEFDIVFSSFTMLWVLNQHLFLEGAYRSLKSQGYLIITTPLNFSLTLESSIETIISKPEWSSYFRDFFKPWHFIGKKEYTDLLNQHRFIPIRVDEVIQDELFASRESLEKYIHQWFPYFGPLPDDMKEPFFKEVMNSYFASEPVLEDGKAPFKFSRLDIVAKKTSVCQSERN